jgi:hypothetical protein
MQAKFLETTLLNHICDDFATYRCERLASTIAGVSIRQFREDKTRVFGQRMKFDLVYDVGKKLCAKLVAISERNM